MPQLEKPYQKVGELIDRIEQIRDELLAIQRSMEKMEPAETYEDKNKK